MATLQHHRGVVVAKTADWPLKRASTRLGALDVPDGLSAAWKDPIASNALAEASAAIVVEASDGIKVGMGIIVIGKASGMDGWSSTQQHLILRCVLLR